MSYSEKSQPPPYQVGGPSQGTGQYERAGHFVGGSYTINHRDASSTLTISLHGNSRFTSRIESLIHMSKGVKVDSADKYSLAPEGRDTWTKYMTFSGPGTVTLGPDILGDIIALPIDSATDREQWSVRTSLILASTAGVNGNLVKKEFSLGMFHEQEFNHYTLSGKGVFWLRTYGVVDRVDLGAGEAQIVETGHLAAWTNCSLSPVKLGGKKPSFVEVQGPGTIYVQARKVEDWIDLAKWASSH
ncbi:unnamed protein product [Clonostachys chloroleuca]|uniref:Altered inheritance of mitochondria protein 24, mitochondrial n=1 Tax=Clonostachys chloroleuca TaxID=1926264 RepID=A0AA35Q6D6_9HYPO|nr:unnamed protein product [Clonostachys chloroleuca]